MRGGGGGFFRGGGGFDNALMFLAAAAPRAAAARVDCFGAAAQRATASALVRWASSLVTIIWKAAVSSGEADYEVGIGGGE